MSRRLTVLELSQNRAAQDRADHPFSPLTSIDKAAATGFATIAVSLGAGRNVPPPKSESRWLRISLARDDHVDEFTADEQERPKENIDRCYNK